MVLHEPRASRGRKRRGCWRRLGLLAGVVASLAAGQALAGSFELDWTAPDGCPKAAFVEAEVARVVGRPWSELSAEWLEAHAEINLGDRGYRVRVTVVTPAGHERTRSVVAASCTEAAEAAVAILTAGMAMDASASALTGSGAASTAPPPIAARAGPSDATRAVDSAAVGELGTTAGTPARPLVAAHAGVDIGSLAAVAPFVQLSAGLAWGRLSTLVSVSATGSVIRELDDSSAGAQMSLLLGGATTCWRVTTTNPSLGGCAGVELGSLAARGIGTVDSRSGRVFWSASVARAVLDWNIGSASVVSIGATTVFPFRHLRVISNPDEVHRTPSVALRPWIGLGVLFE